MNETTKKLIIEVLESNNNALRLIAVGNEGLKDIIVSILVSNDMIIDILGGKNEND